MNTKYQIKVLSTIEVDAITGKEKVITQTNQTPATNIAVQLIDSDVAITERVARAIRFQLKSGLTLKQAVTKVLTKEMENNDW